MANEDELIYSVDLVLNQQSAEQIRKQVNDLAGDFDKAFKESGGVKEFENSLGEVEKVTKKVTKANNEQVQSFVKMQKRLEEARQERTALNKVLKEEGGLTDENIQKKIELDNEIKELSGTINKNRRDTIKLNEGNLASVRTYDDLVAKNKALSIQMRQVPLDDTSGKLQKLQDEYRANNDRLKDFDESMGNHHRNVGNYSESVQNALMELGGLPPSLEKAKQAQKAFNMAIKANPLGLIIVALGALIGAFKSTQEGTDRLNKILVPLKSTFQVLLGLVQKISVAFINDFTEAVKSPKKSLETLMGFIQSQFSNRIEGLVNQFKGLGSVIQGVLSFDWDQVKQGGKDFGEAYIQTITGVEDAIGKTKKAFAGASDLIQEGIEKGSELVDLQIRIEEMEIAQQVPLAKLKKLYEENKQAADNVLASEEERLASAERGLEAYRELTNQQLELIDLRIEKMKLEQSLNDTSREEQLELQKLIAQRERFEEERISRTTELINKKRAIQKQEAEEAKRLAEEEFNQAVELAEREKSEKLLALKEELAQKQISRKEYEREVTEIQEQSLENELRIREQYGMDVMNVENEILNAKLDRIHAEAQAEEEAREKNLAMERQNAEVRRGIYQNSMSAISSINEAYFNNNKSLAIAMALIDTFQGAQAVFAQTPGGIFARSIAAASAIAAGLLRVKKIKEVDKKKGSGSTSTGASGASRVRASGLGSNADREQGITVSSARGIADSMTAPRGENTTNIYVENKLDREGLALAVREGNNSISSRNMVEITNE